MRRIARSPESAGILLYRHPESGGGPEVLLAHPGGPFWSRKDIGAWTIPKGECEEGEELLDCALRELAEELGPAPELDRGSLIELGTVRQRSGKIVHGWAAEGDFEPASLAGISFSIEWPPRSGKKSDFPEIDRVEWFEPAAAREKLLPAQVPFVDRLLERLR